MDVGELDAELRSLRTRGGSAIEAIHLIRRETGVSLGAAKDALHAHPAWADVAAAAGELHDALEREFARFANRNANRS